MPPVTFSLIEQFAGRFDPPPSADQVGQARAVHRDDVDLEHVGSIRQLDQLVTHGQRSAGQHQGQRQIVGGVDQLTEHSHRVAVGVVQILRAQGQRAGGAHLLDGGQHPVAEVRQRRVLRDETDQRGDQIERPAPAGLVGGDPERTPDATGQAAQQGVGARRLAHPRGAREQHGCPAPVTATGREQGQEAVHPPRLDAQAGFADRRHQLSIPRRRSRSPDLRACRVVALWHQIALIAKGFSVVGRNLLRIPPLPVRAPSARWPTGRRRRGVVPLGHVYVIDGRLIADIYVCPTCDGGCSSVRFATELTHRINHPATSRHHTGAEHVPD